MINNKLYLYIRKLYQKKRRHSAKKKTPGKKKTPKSVKRQQQLQIVKPESSVASSKRALFTSPLAGTSQSRENLSSSRGVLPRRNLFSPQQNAKRKRSPSPDTENRFGKNRRLDSPSKQSQLISKSRSFSNAPLTSSVTFGSLEEHYKKTLFYRTQSEMALDQPSSDCGRSNNNYRLSDVDKKVKKYIDLKFKCYFNEIFLILI